ncbi:MAG: NAD(P)/FAD-dependent oxidoreductase [Caulobacteraceae bacterium]
MDARRLSADVLIAGGGPAGCAAAITCGGLGLSVILAEREDFPRHRPGEALHPGVDTLLNELGVLERIDAVTGARFSGIEVAWNAPARFEPFGEDETGPWLGRHVDRAAFDALLLDRARELGVTVLQPCAVKAPLMDGARIGGAVTDAGNVDCRILIDATGAGRLLPRKLALLEQHASPALTVRYGYVKDAVLDAPSLVADQTGWTWVAQVAPSRIQWVRLDLDGSTRSKDWLPPALAHFPPDGPARCADVQWRLCETAAGPGWFIAGDAAAQLDPTSSHGVLKALMSGMMAARTAAAMLRGGDEAAGARAYQAWLAGWFATDIAHLAPLYAQLGTAGFGETAKTPPAASAI